MQLFIDTNIYLNFYQHTNDDVESLDKLRGHVQKGNIVLHVFAQIRDEFERNRDSKLQTALSEFKGGKFLSAIPRHMQSLSMSNVYARAIKDAQKARDVLIAQAVADARLNKLDVDVKLNAIFECAKSYPHDDALFSKAKLRAERGNPPGKAGSLGDQYNWEFLLDKLPADDLYIVSNDGDYASSLTEGSDGTIYPDSVLRREWNECKGGKSLYVFDTIKKVLAHYNKTLAEEAAPKAKSSEKVVTQAKALSAKTNPVTSPPTVKSADAANAHTFATKDNNQGAIGSDQTPLKITLSKKDQDSKLAAIAAISESSNFASTHLAIGQLTPFKDCFSAAEVDTLLRTALTNNQIRWIINDEDVKEFYLHLFSEYLLAMDDDLLEPIIKLLGLVTPEPELEAAENEP